MAAGDLDVSLTLTGLLPVLKAQGWDKLTWWNQTQLYSMADQGAKQLARTAGVFVDRDTTLATSPGDGTYTLPADHISTIHASFSGQSLKAASVQDLEALDASWVDAIDVAPRFFLLLNGLDSIAIYPAPDGTIVAPVDLILQRFPPAITAVQPLVAGPAPLQDYIEFYVLAQALGAESKGAMPEVAAWFSELCGLFEQAAISYWGSAD